MRLQSYNKKLVSPNFFQKTFCISFAGIGFAGSCGFLRVKKGRAERRGQVCCYEKTKFKFSFLVFVFFELRFDGGNGQV
ncbi:MAG: hypothetical protein K2F58_06170, partial [Muribaculaceae bacterium]|nr:hypothetical protein [Muribaculaceae bacterium]